MTTPLDTRTYRQHRFLNRMLSVVLLITMAGLLGAIGWSVAGGLGLAATLVLGSSWLFFSPKLPPALLMRWMGAREITDWHELKFEVFELAQRARLATMPRVFYLPNRGLNAMALGGPQNSAIAVTTGLLESLDRRQLRGVLAHEISHVAGDDLRVLGMAAAFGRLTHTMAWIGLLLLFLNLPILALAGSGVPWLTVLLLMFAPTVSFALQMWLSRTREFHADLGAARLTGDPAGLASALDYLDRVYERIRYWRRFLWPGQVEREAPEILSSHPQTRERIRRLLALRPGSGPRTRQLAI